MHRLLVISIALAIGCRDEGIARLGDVKAKVCACKTAECAEAAMKVIPSTQVKSNPRSQKIAREMLDCLAKLYEKERPVTGPDDDKPVDDKPTGDKAGSGAGSAKAAPPTIAPPTRAPPTR